MHIAPTPVKHTLTRELERTGAFQGLPYAERTDARGPVHPARVAQEAARLERRQRTLTVLLAAVWAGAVILLAAALLGVAVGGFWSGLVSGLVLFAPLGVARLLTVQKQRLLYDLLDRTEAHS